VEVAAFRAAKTKSISKASSGKRTSRGAEETPEARLDGKREDRGSSPKGAPRKECDATQKTGEREWTEYVDSKQKGGGQRELGAMTTIQIQRTGGSGDKRKGPGGRRHGNWGADGCLDKERIL